MNKKIVKLFVVLFLFPALVFSSNPEIDNIYGNYIIARTKKKISLDLESVSLNDMLKVFSKQSGLNFICKEDVKDRLITVYLEDVPLIEAINTIFNANGLVYDYFPESKIFVVKEAPKIDYKTKVYRLKYVRVNSSNLENEAIKLMGGNSSGGGQTSAVSLKDAVEKLLTPNGKVSEDKLTNSLIVTDVPSQFSIIDELIDRLDIPQPKILIEAEVLDVSKRDVDKLGVEWPEELLKLDVTGRRATSFPFTGKHKPKTGNILWKEFTSPGGVEFSEGFSAHDFTPSVLTVIGAELVLNFLKTRTDARSLARPKILTVSNEVAEIKMTTNEAVGIKKTETGEGQSVEYTIERVETGTILRVTPQVNLDTKEITLLVDISEKQARESGFFTSSQAFIEGSIKDPEERSAKSIVRLKDGEVLLIGGLIRNVESDTGKELPIFSKIPLLGNIFKSKNKTVQERELFIFITPHILEDQLQLSNVSPISILREQGSSLRKEAIASALNKFTKESYPTKK
ncbi:MAG: hypothetical protein NC822_00490 [Candidatus Omnitrophica bacterium]|nr:hypothetical protein [Candidatus Omnitrophota bacterium]MCM8826551.1 hypothetical protein [Candidatus Omnitrophota bacterium]